MPRSDPVAMSFPSCENVTEKTGEDTFDSIIIFPVLTPQIPNPMRELDTMNLESGENAIDGKSVGPTCKV